MQEPQDNGHAARTAASPSADNECTDAASEQSRLAHPVHGRPATSSRNTLSSVQDIAAEVAGTHSAQELRQLASSASKSGMAALPHMFGENEPQPSPYVLWMKVGSS